MVAAMWPHIATTRQNVKIRVIEGEEAFNAGLMIDIVAGIKRALDTGRKRYVIILPAPNPNYAIASKWRAQRAN